MSIFRILLNQAHVQAEVGLFIPPPPYVPSDVDTTDIMLFMSDKYPGTEIEVRVNGGSFNTQPESGYAVGDVDLPAGYFQGRIKAAEGRAASEIVLSPAFTKNPEVATGRAMQEGSFFTGDSIAADYSAEDGKGFVKLTFADLGVANYTNLASPGETVTQQTIRLATAMPLVSTVPFGAEDGVNSFKKAGEYGYDNTIRDIISNYVAKAAMLWAKQTYHMNEFTASVTAGLVPVDGFLDSFGARAKQGRLAGKADASWHYKSSCVQGEALTKTISGTGFAVLYYKSSSNSRIQVTCDNIVIATTEAGTNVGNYLIEAVVFDGLAAGNHNIVITAIDGGKTLGIDCVIALKTPAECADIPFYVIDVPNLGDAPGLGLSSDEFKPTSNTEIDRCSIERFAALKSKFNGRPFFRINPKDQEGYDPNDTTQTTDKLHPLSKGHRKWADAWLAKMER